ncbi:ABC transporter ATP-binding protein [Pirellula sp. SH-Sr6A]|uniref:ABC transporter ATP-binding protein n=1 Tax=Pirellula sp. SH-Sr6A TaxID=1632865 RepID=UPI00197BB75A|nr:ABC transporter ATP-binding protein [Pirellula sp. SH-Sr6A]
MLRVDGIRKKFGATEALRGLSFEVREGERLALLGPNGAGKTTLIRAICGRVRPDSGSVTLLGKPIHAPGALLHLGVIPQELAIYPDLTAKENLECFGRLHGLRSGSLRERVAWALEWIGLTDRAHDLTRTFSGGMKRRVNIACGVLHRPRVLLLDEPTVGVDPQSRQRIFDMLDELHFAGTSIVLTTHHLEEAEQRSDRIVIVDHGQVIAEGTIQSLLESTIGSDRLVSVSIEGLMVTTPKGLRWDSKTERFHAYIGNVAEELPELLQSIQRLGGTLKDLDVHQPNLHDVFLHLTGKELRE